MSTITVGYDWSTGDAKTFTAIATAIADAGTGAGDQLDIYAYTNTGARQWYTAELAVNKAIIISATLANGRQMLYGTTQLAVCSVAGVTIQGFMYSAANSYGNIYFTHNTGTSTVQNCIGVGGACVQTNTSGGTTNIINCLFIGGAKAANTIYCVNGNMNLYHCTLFCAGTYGVKRDAGTCVVRNTVVVNTNGGGYTCFSGTFDASCSNNASTDNTHPNTGGGGVRLDRGQSDAKFWMDQASSAALGLRIHTGSALATAGADLDIATDFYGRTRHATTPSIGYAEIWAMPSCPTADKILTGNSGVGIDGVTVNGTATSGGGTMAYAFG